MIPFGTVFVKERMLEIIFRKKKNDAWDGQVLNSINPMKARIIRSIKLIAITVFSFDLRSGPLMLEMVEYWTIWIQQNQE